MRNCRTWASGHGRRNAIGVGALSLLSRIDLTPDSQPSFREFWQRGLEAVILNEAMILVVVDTALPFREAADPFADVLVDWLIIVDLLACSLRGAWFGAGWATRLRSETLYRVIASMPVAIAVMVMVGYEASTGQPLATGGPQIGAGVVGGFIIGIVAALLSVAGGELLIPTPVLQGPVRPNRPGCR